MAIEDINISDSDNYTCKVEYINPDSGHLKKETYTHSVSGKVNIFLYHNLCNITIAKHIFII